MTFIPQFGGMLLTNHYAGKAEVSSIELGKLLTIPSLNL